MEMNEIGEDMKKQKQIKQGKREREREREKTLVLLAHSVLCIVFGGGAVPLISVSGFRGPIFSLSL
jgi:hypothetical protein